MHDLALCDQAHEFDLATKGSDREAASNRLGQSDEVGCHSELASGTAVPGGDAGLSLVQDKYRSVTLGDSAHGLGLTRLGAGNADVLASRLEHEAGHVASMYGPFEGGRIVERDHGDIVDHPLRDPQRARDRVGLLNRPREL